MNMDFMKRFRERKVEIAGEGVSLHTICKRKIHKHHRHEWKDYFNDARGGDIQGGRF